MDYDNVTLLQRMDESQFEWISLNVKNNYTGGYFGSAIPSKIIEFHQDPNDAASPSVRVLIIGLTIDENEGEDHFVSIDSEENSLIKLVTDYIKPLKDAKRFDICVGLTHLDIDHDSFLVDGVAMIDLIIGGHEHINYGIQRGLTLTPIYKADANTATVYIHRLAWNLSFRPSSSPAKQPPNFKQAAPLFIQSTLTHVTPLFDEDPGTARVADFWFNLGLQGFKNEGFDPLATVCTLPEGVILDGREAAVRAFPTRLTEDICLGMLSTTAASSATIATYNTGSIRIDDQLEGIITQYDLLRALPFANPIRAVTVPGELLAQVLTTGLTLKNNGMFLSACGVSLDLGSNEWRSQGQNIATSGLNYTVATTDYMMLSKHTALDDPRVPVIQKYSVTTTWSLIAYLQKLYPQQKN
jgi:5'-nucleotidase/UDP-sugar diphosphatase